MNSISRVVITGASSGLGATLATSLAKEGISLGLLARRGKMLAEVSKACKEFGVEVIEEVGDVTQVDDCRRIMDRTFAQFNGIDCVIANAGISMWTKFDEVEDPSVFARLMEVNYLGVVHSAYSSMQYLKDSRGLFVAISSVQGKVPVPLHSGYVASKHAVQGFCNSLRIELHGSGVDVMTVLPHWLRDTNLRNSALGADGKKIGNSSRKHSNESISLEAASSEIIKSLKKRPRELVIPWKLKFLSLVFGLRPQWAEAVIRRVVNKQDQ